MKDGKADVYELWLSTSEDNYTFFSLNHDEREPIAEDALLMCHIKAESAEHAERLKDEYLNSLKW